MDNQIDNNVSDEESYQLSFHENENGFDASLVVKQDMLRNVKSSKLELQSQKIFKIPGFITGLLKRTNEVFYFVNTCEMHVDIKDTSGAVYLPLITKTEINKNLQKIDEKIRSKMTVVHLGAIKILLKAEFQEGINTPIKMALIDNR